MQYVAIYRGSKAYVVLKSTTFVEGSSVHTRLAAPQHTVRGPRPSVRQLGPRDGGLKGEELCDPDQPVSTMGVICRGSVHQHGWGRPSRSTARAGELVRQVPRG